MIDTIYIEREVETHKRALQITKRFPKAHIVSCNRYGEIFNTKAQNFRIQKQNPSLILAKKYGSKVLAVPEGYTLGKPHNFYFSYMLNCMFDCRYCFLQGMYRSAHYVVFVNFEDFKEEIAIKIKEYPDGATFFSGYDADSLAFDHITQFLDAFVPFFKNHPKHELEIRSKSANIRSLIKHEPQKNIIVAMSLNPSWVIEHFEHKTPRLHQRLKRLKELQDLGWPIGLRFDPLIYHPNWEQNYSDFFEEVFQTLDPQKIHSITLGPFRLPISLYKRIANLFPDEALFFHEIEENQKLMTYKQEIEEKMHTFCSKEILERVPDSIFFPSLLKEVR